MHWWVVVHVVGAVLGAGAATVNDVLFLRAIGNPIEGEAYKRYASTLSLIAWTGILLLIVSAIAFWWIKPEILHSQKILVKIGLTALVTVNGAVMGVLLIPRIHALQQDDWKNAAKLQWAVKPGALLGSISIVSWYALILLGAIGRTGWTAAQIIPWYASALIVVWIVGRVIVGRRLNLL